MPSSFTWLDYSESERQKSLDVINLFKNQDTRDELGLGTIRDAFADLFFPGTGTVQTRAKYFLFIPWIYRRLETKLTPSEEIQRRARKAEIDLIYSLEEGGETEGIIGIDAREKLQRLPSNIYWLGLGAWGIRKFRGSQAQYHRYLNRWYGALRVRSGDDKESGAMKAIPNWHPELPAAPGDFPNVASFALSREEARFLEEQLLLSHPRSLLTWLVSCGKAYDATDFPWMHPQYSEFPVSTKQQLEHARNFSEVMHGASLLYNLLLSRNTNNKSLVDNYLERVKAWEDLVESRKKSLVDWSRKEFWDLIISLTQIHLRTREFVNTWFSIVIDDKTFSKSFPSAAAEDLIKIRESQLKGTLARLHNQAARELWNGASGTGQIDYRWPVTQNIVIDVLRGLDRGKRNA